MMRSGSATGSESREGHHLTECGAKAEAKGAASDGIEGAANDAGCVPDSHQLCSNGKWQSQSAPGPAACVKCVDVACKDESIYSAPLNMTLSRFPCISGVVVATLKSVSYTRNFVCTSVN